MSRNITVHCVACGSQNIEEINGVKKWDVEKQEWVETDSPIGYMYECNDCGEESDEYKESEDVYDNL